MSVKNGQPMSILGRFLPVESLLPDRQLPSQSVPMKSVCMVAFELSHIRARDGPYIDTKIAAAR